MEKGKQLQNDMLLLKKKENNEQVCTLHRFVHSIEVYCDVQYSTQTSEWLIV